VTNYSKSDQHFVFRYGYYLPILTSNPRNTHKNGVIISHYLTTTVNRNRIVIIQDTEDYCNQLPTGSFPITPIEERNDFVIHLSHAYISKKIPTIRTFDEFIKSKLDWIFKLIKHYRIYRTESLLSFLATQNPLIISTDGSKKTFKYGGSWIIATTIGNHLTSGYLLIFGQQKDINSYRTEIYASLTSLLFLQSYSELFMVEILNPIDAICDNKCYVTRLK